MAKHEIDIPSYKNSSLKICYWNIHGWSCTDFGNKLINPDFLKKNSGYDIVALAELHSAEEVSLPGFISIKQKIRKKIHKGPKIAGGVGVFVKKEIYDMIQFMPTSNPDSIWIRIKKDFSNQKDDIYLGTFYVSPDRKKSKLDFFSYLDDDVKNFQNKGIVLVQGDLNARTGRLPDFIEADKFDTNFGIVNPSQNNLRNSQDTNVNSRGRDLIDFCKMTDMLIVNGRKLGDIFGNMTSHQWNGSAVNDYLLAPKEFFQKVTHFAVGEFSPWFSDHCPIFTTILLDSLRRTKSDEAPLCDPDDSFVFDENSKQRFCLGLNSTKNMEKLESLLTNDKLTPLQIGSEIKSLLLSNATECNVRKAKNTSQNTDPSPTWFDKECKRSKNQLNKMGE